MGSVYPINNCRSNGNPLFKMHGTARRSKRMDLRSKTGRWVCRWN